jgi:GMP synthase (glutamine-hydrolysing)
MLARRPRRSSSPAARPVVYADGAPGSTRRCSRPASRSSASATASRRWPARSAARSPAPAPASTAAPRSPSRARHAVPGLPAEQSVWMSHGDSVTKAPEGFTVTASSRAAGGRLRGRRARLAGVQFHPEVLHTEHGQEVLEHFLLRDRRLRAHLDDGQHRRRAGRARSARRSATAGDLRAVRRRRLRGGRRARAAGHRRPADLRVRRPRPAAQGRGRAGRARLRRRHRRRPAGRRRRERFLAALAGVTDPEEKRKIIGREFIRVFEAAAARGGRRAGAHGERSTSSCRARSTPTSSSPAAASRHRQHQEPPQRRRAARRPEFELVEPLRALFKDEVRRVGARARPARGRSCGASRSPAPGLGIRIIGEVTRERLDVLREADAIAREELTAPGLDRDIWQCPVVLLADVRSVGVQGDGRTYGHPSCCARCPPRTR